MKIIFFECLNSGSYTVSVDLIYASQRFCGVVANGPTGDVNARLVRGTNPHTSIYQASLLKAGPQFRQNDVLCARAKMTALQSSSQTYLSVMQIHPHPTLLTLTHGLFWEHNKSDAQ